MQLSAFREGWQIHDDLGVVGYYRQFVYRLHTADGSAGTAQLCDALNRRHTPRSAPLAHPPSMYVTHVVAPAGGELRLDTEELRNLGVQRVMVVDADRKGQVLADGWEVMTHCCWVVCSVVVSTGWGNRPGASWVTRSICRAEAHQQDRKTCKTPRDVNAASIALTLDFVGAGPAGVQP